MHTEKPFRDDDLLGDEELSELSGKIIGPKKRAQIIQELSRKKLYKGKKRHSLRVRSYSFLLIAASLLLMIYAGYVSFFDTAEEEPHFLQQQNLIACLDAVDEPLSLLALDRDRGTESTEVNEEDRIEKLFQIAGQNYQKQDYSGASVLYEEILEQDTANALNLLFLAHCQSKLKAYEKAVKTYDCALNQSVVEQNGDLIYTTKFYRAISRLRLAENDSIAAADLESIASQKGYHQAAAAKILSKM